MLLILIVALVSCDGVLSSPAAIIDNDEKTDLHNHKVFLRAWSEEDAKLSSREESLVGTPDVLPLTIHSDSGRRVHGLLLTRNTDIEHPVEIVFGDEREYAPLVAEGEAHYHDALSGAIFSVRHIDGIRHFDGSFAFDGDHYELHPSEDDISSVKARGFEDYPTHVVTRTARNSYHGDILVDTDTPMNSSVSKRGCAKGTHHVEVAMVVDYSEYFQWKKKVGSKAKEAILYKYSYQYNGLDRIYKGIRGMKPIKVWLKKIVVYTSYASSGVYAMAGANYNPAYVQRDRYKSYPLDGVHLLNILFEWGPKNQLGVPNDVDHVMYFIGYDLQQNQLAGVIGLAYVGGVCGYKGWSLFEDQGFESYRTVAHELGHNLGCDHDPYGAHIMAPMESLNNINVAWTFSDFSVRQMSATMASKTCFKNKGSNTGRPTVRPLPGVKYDADFQCALLSEKYNKHCFSGTVRSTDCNQALWCGFGPDPEGSGCRSFVGRPADGTKCQGGQCITGKCT